MSDKRHAPRIVVAGVGNEGIHALNSLVSELPKGVTCVALRFDSVEKTIAFDHSRAEHKIWLGSSGPNSRHSESIPARVAELPELFAGADIVFIATGKEGLIDTKIAPLVANLVKSMGIFSVGVVVGSPAFCCSDAEPQIADRSMLDSLILILLDGTVSAALSVENCPPRNASNKKDRLLYIVKCISDLVCPQGIIKLDMDDVRSVLRGANSVIVGYGACSGADRAKEAALQAIDTSLPEGSSLDNCQRVLINITYGSDLEIDEVSEIASIVQKTVHPDAHVFFGTAIDESLREGLQVTVLATSQT